MDNFLRFFLIIVIVVMVFLAIRVLVLPGLSLDENEVVDTGLSERSVSSDGEVYPDTKKEMRPTEKIGELEEEEDLLFFDFDNPMVVFIAILVLGGLAILVAGITSFLQKDMR